MVETVTQQDEATRLRLKAQRNHGIIMIMVCVFGLCVIKYREVVQGEDLVRPPPGRAHRALPLSLTTRDGRARRGVLLYRAVCQRRRSRGQAAALLPPPPRSERVGVASAPAGRLRWPFAKPVRDLSSVYTREGPTPWRGGE